MALIIDFKDKPAEIIVQPELRRTFSSITILKINDDYRLKKVTALTSELGEITLWEGYQYDEIGQWTDLDVVNRIIQKYANTK